MNRIHTSLAELAARKEKALAIFLTSGFPHLESTVGLAHELRDAGADLIELGMPFSDPLADGPVIQHSSSVALRNGVTLATIFRQVREIRGSSSIPIILMGYLNPVLRYGTEKFFCDARESGVDGLIFPELPLEESGRFKNLMETNRLANILLVAPTSSPARIKACDEASSGFLYCVSTTGVTGSSNSNADHIDRIRQYVSRNPLLVGFGIATPEDARSFSTHADGVIVGSALIKKLQSKTPLPELKQWVRSLKNAMNP